MTPRLEDSILLKVVAGVVTGDLEGKGDYSFYNL
jgi:hypothetical protein